METTSTILDDIDGKFCQCCLCFKQYEDPRQLPCFHRYCSRCLDEEIERTHGDLRCPLCQQEADVPEDGAQGLKKDFFMNEIIEFLDIKKSFQNEEKHECGDCSKIVKARSYCFRCSEFLCDVCHEHHKMKKILKEHRPYLLTLDDVKSKNLTLQKLNSLKQAPMCKTHQDDVSRLCCKTCENMPICTACTYGGHKSHDIEDAISLATVKRGVLRDQLAILTESKSKVKQHVEEALRLQKDIVATADVEIAKLDHDAGEELNKISKDLQAVSEEHSNASGQIRDKWEVERERRQQTLDEEINRIRKVHKEMEQKFRNEMDTHIRESDKTYSEKKSKLLSKQGNVEKQLQEGKALISMEKGKKLETTEGAIVNGKGTIERMQNLIETGSNILVSENNWTAIQNADRVCAASEPLIRELGGEFPKRDEVLEYSQVRLSLETAEEMEISDNPVIEVAIEDIKRNMWVINSVAAAPDGTIVITGGTKEQNQAHISVIKLDGKISKQKLIYSCSHRHCSCAYFRDDEFAIATRCNANIGLYNSNSDAYHSTDLRKVIDQEVKIRCITADGSNDQIIVGCENDPVLYVLNGKLQLTRTIDLQQIVKSPRDIVVNNGTIFICCENSKSAYAANMEGGLLHELLKPDSTSVTRPFSVCTSNNGSVYVLWAEIYASSVQDCVITQYNPDDGSVLTTTPVRAIPGWMVAAEIDGAEKLLLQSWSGGMLRVYGLQQRHRVPLPPSPSASPGARHTPSHDMGKQRHIGQLTTPTAVMIPQPSPYSMQGPKEQMRPGAIPYPGYGIPRKGPGTTLPPNTASVTQGTTGPRMIQPGVYNTPYTIPSFNQHVGEPMIPQMYPGYGIPGQRPDTTLPPYAPSVTQRPTWPRTSEYKTRSIFNMSDFYGVPRPGTTLPPNTASVTQGTTERRMLQSGVANAPYTIPSPKYYAGGPMIPQMYSGYGVPRPGTTLPPNTAYVTQGTTGPRMIQPVVANAPCLTPSHQKRGGEPKIPQTVSSEPARVPTRKGSHRP